MNVIKEFRNNLLKRNEIVAVGKYDSNPGFENAKKDVAKTFKAEEDKIVVRKVDGHFGANEFRVEAFVYDKTEDKERIEPKKKEKKK